MFPSGNRSGPDAQADRLLDDVTDGRLDDFSLIEAALIAEGVSDARQRAMYVDRFQQYLRQLADIDAPRAVPRQRAAIVLRFLHDKILTHDYLPDASRLTQVFQAGQFNCVSSAVLFQALCDEIGLRVSPVIGAGHISCVVRSEGATWLVETTCEDWPSRLVAKDKRLLFDGMPADATCPKRRIVSTARLLSVIYYNDGLQLLSGGNYPLALAANLAAWQVDRENLDAKENLLATINNWAVALAAEDHYADAAAILAKGRQIEPGYDKFLHNEIFVHDRWVRHLWEQHRYGEAVQLLQSAHRRYPQVPFYQLALPQTLQHMYPANVAKNQHTDESAALAGQRAFPLFDVDVPVR